jgi:hypothetical protein
MRTVSCVRLCSWVRRPSGARAKAHPREVLRRDGSEPRAAAANRTPSSPEGHRHYWGGSPLPSRILEDPSSFSPPSPLSGRARTKARFDDARAVRHLVSHEDRHPFGRFSTTWPRSFRGSNVVRRFASCDGTRWSRGWSRRRPRCPIRPTSSRVPRRYGVPSRPVLGRASSSPSPAAPDDLPRYGPPAKALLPPRILILATPSVPREASLTPCRSAADARGSEATEGVRPTATAG